MACLAPATICCDSASLRSAEATGFMAKETMKKLLFSLALFPIGSLACIVPPIQLEVSESNGFSFSEKPMEFHESIDEINIVAPLVYKGKKFELGIFSIFFNGILVAKSIQSRINESGVPEFVGYVSNKPDFSYSVSFLYGEGRCKSYEFTASNQSKQP